MHLRMLERDLLGGDTDINQCTGRRKILECARHRVPIPCRVNDHREHVAPCDSVHPFKFRRVPFVQNGILDPIIGSNKFQSRWVHIHHTDLRARQTGELQSRKTDWTGADNQRMVIRPGTTSVVRVTSYGKRFDQR